MRRALGERDAPGVGHQGRECAGHQQQVLDATERHRADFMVTTKGFPNVLGVVHALAVDPATAWVSPLGRETDAGSEIVEATASLLGRTVRLIVRRQPKAAGA